jgi:hypothetical protein
MLRTMETAPTDRPITIRATCLIVGLGPFDEKPFDVVARFYADRGYWAAEDRPANGLPSLGLVPLSPIGWLC